MMGTHDRMSLPLAWVESEGTSRIAFPSHARWFFQFRNLSTIFAGNS